MIDHVRSFRFWVLGLAFIGTGTLAGCLSDDSPDSGDAGEAGTSGTSGATGGTGTGGTGAGTGGTAGTAGTTGGAGPSGGTGGTGAPGTACESPIVLTSDQAAITDFEAYDGTDLATWFFPLGGDTTTGILAGTFGYGDDHPDANNGELPETFEMIAGNDSTYALGIADSLAEDFGGGMGLWISECLDATAFSGLSFWVRGNAPTGDAKISIMMQETTSSMPETSDSKVGTCAGTTEQCIHPVHTFPVTDTWTEVRAAWSTFIGGNANETPVSADGRNIWQIQLDIGLVWVDDGTGTDTYVPTPGEYELVIDDVAFY